MEYKATYDITCGLSHGFGLKEPHHYVKEEEISAEDDDKALYRLVVNAIKHSRDHLSSPVDDFTTVVISGFYGPQGRIDIREYLNKKGYSGININGRNYFEWNEQNQLVTKCSTLEHLLLLGAESKHKEESQQQKTENTQVN